MRRKTVDGSTPGQAMEAFERFYADDVVMQENTEPPREGKDACRKYEEEFFGNVAEFHESSFHGSAAQGDRSYSEWVFDITFKDGLTVLAGAATHKA